MKSARLVSRTPSHHRALASVPIIPATTYSEGMDIMRRVSATTLVAPSARPVVEKEVILAAVTVGQQMAGHFPTEDDLGRARRLLDGEITLEQAFAEVDSLFPVR